MSSILCIKDTAFNWFISYLTDRSQTVLVDTSFSEPSVLTCGVPLGSVLGPILFSLYTSDLGKLIESLNIERHFFADDSHLMNKFAHDPEIVKPVLHFLEAC